MDFLNKYFAQIRELFEGMTPGARITSALLLAVTVASLGYLFTSGFNPGGDVFLLDNRVFSSDDLAPMIGAFATEGLGDYEIVAGRIRVPQGKKTDYVAALAKAGALPHDFSSILDSALEKSGTFEDKRKLEARLRHAKQKFLGEVLSSMSGIERAAVLFDETTGSGIRRERVVTASVSIKPIGTHALDDGQIRSICQTMVGAVAGLKPEKVVVMDLNTFKSHRGSASDSSDGEGGDMAKKRREQEEDFRRKIEELLAYVPGVIVTPTVELTPESVHKTESMKWNKEDSVSVNTIEKKSSRDSTGESKGGRPGYTLPANTARSLPVTESKGAEENEKTSEMVDSKVPAGEKTEKEFAAHMIDRVSVAIAVPTSYFSKIWQKRNPTPGGEEPQEPPAGDIETIRVTETARIKSIVAGALPKDVDGKAPVDLVEVTDFEDIIPPLIPEPTMTENAGSWFAQNWNTIGLILLGLFSLVMLRSMIRSTPPGATKDMADPGSIPRETGAAEENEEGEAPRTIGFSGSGSSLQEELTELVATDPETAANILKNWIGAAAK